MKRTIGRIAAKAAPWAQYIAIGLSVLLFLSVIRASLNAHIPEEKRIWFELSFILLVAVASEYLVAFLKQPNVMVLIILGVAISPSAVSYISPYVCFAVNAFLGPAGYPLAQTGFELVSTKGMITIFAQLGSIFLLFDVGLHCEVSKIFNKKNFYVALLGVIVPFMGGYLYAISTGHGFAYSMFLGAALTATSVGVTAAVLEEFKVLDKDYARIILGAAVIDDILGLLVLSIVENTPSSLDMNALAPLLTILLTAAIFVLGAIKMGERIVSRFFSDCCDHKGKVRKNLFLWILVYVLAYAYTAEYIGLSAIVGAFIAGVTLNYSKSVGSIIEVTYPLEAFFTPVFFISLGMLVDINALYSSLIPIIIVTLIAIVTKIIGCGIAAKTSGSNLRESTIIGLGMIPRGEVALIIGLYGLTAKILTPAEYSIIASMAFLTTVIIPVILHAALGKK